MDSFALVSINFGICQIWWLGFTAILAMTISVVISYSNNGLA